MFSIQRSGSAAGIAADMRSLPASTVPLIAAKALTFTAQKAQASILAKMPSVFQGGATRYTLNSTRIEPATVDKLSARVAVKDQATNGGTLPENYLFPEVFGGRRKEKRFERALRYGGLLRAGEYALPGDFAPLDAQGNLRVGQLRTLLNSVAGLKRGEPARGRKASPGTSVRGDLFVGTPGKPGALPGVYRRAGGSRRGGRKLQPLLVFVRKAPSFSRRLDFEGLAATAARDEFPAIFNRLLRTSTAAR